MGVVVISLMSSLLQWKQYMHLQIYPNISSQYQFWRIIVSHLAFTRSGEVLIGALLLYQFRLVERLYGPPKYASFLVYSALSSTFLQVGVLIFGRSIKLVSLPAGPYAIIFSILYQYYSIVPAVYRYRVLGIPIGDKLFIYSLAAQLLVTRAPNSLASALCGLLTGISYQFNFAGAKKRRLPNFITKLITKFLFTIMDSAPPPRHNSPTRPTETTSDGTTTGFTESAPAVAVRGTMSSTSLVSESIGSNLAQVDELHSMFPHLDRDDVVRALTLSHNNLNNAAAALLETSSHQ